jgi:hypothetical protein
MDVGLWHFSDMVDHTDDVRSLGESRLDPKAPTLPSLTRSGHLVSDWKEPNLAIRSRRRSNMKARFIAAAACGLVMTQAFLSAPAAAPVIRKNGMDPSHP